MKKTVILILTVFLAYSVGASFGVIASQQDLKTSETNISYRIGFVNTGEPLDVVLNGSDSKDYNLSFQNSSFTLEKSEITSDPSGRGWYALGEKYAKIEYREFRLEIADDLRKDKINFTVRIAASGAASGNKVSQVREKVYSVEMEGGTNEPIYWEEVENVTESREEQDYNSSTNETNEKNFSENQREKKEPVEKNSGSLNWFLVLSVVLLGLYVVKEL